MTPRSQETKKGLTRVKRHRYIHCIYIQLSQRGQIFLLEAWHGNSLYTHESMQSGGPAFSSRPGPSCSKTDQRIKPGFLFLVFKSIFLDNFLCYFQSFQSSACRQKELKLKCLSEFKSRTNPGLSLNNLALTVRWLVPGSTEFESSIMLVKQLTPAIWDS